MGIPFQTAAKYAGVAIEKIDEVYEYIAWHNGEITEGDFNDETNTTISA